VLVGFRRARSTLVIARGCAAASGFPYLASSSVLRRCARVSEVHVGAAVAPRRGGTDEFDAGHSVRAVGADRLQRGGIEDDVLGLFRAYRSHPSNARRNEIARHYPGLAAGVARRFYGRGEPMDDPVQVARFGLLKAIERFDPDRGVSFTSLAVPTMLGELKRHVRDRTWSTKVPREQKELLTRIGPTTDLLTAELRRSPTVTELAARLDVSPEAVILALEARAAYQASSIFASFGGDGGEGTREAYVAARERGLDGADNRLTVRRLLALLPERERRITELRFFEDKTQSEIAEHLGVIQIHVSRLRRRTLDQLGRRVDDLAALGDV